MITTDENGLNLSRADGSFVSTLAVTDTGLVDGGGNTLVPSEGLVFLPTAADALNQTIAFPGKFWKVDHQLSGADECLSICVLYRLFGI